MDVFDDNVHELHRLPYERGGVVTCGLGRCKVLEEDHHNTPERLFMSSGGEREN